MKQSGARREYGRYPKILIAIWKLHENFSTNYEDRISVQYNIIKYFFTGYPIMAMQVYSSDSHIPTF